MAQLKRLLYLRDIVTMNIAAVVRLRGLLSAGPAGFEIL